MKNSGVTVDFIGYRSLKRLLNAAAPEMRKQMDREIVAIIKPVQVEAQKQVPSDPALSGWARSPLKQRDGTTPIRWASDPTKRIKIYTPNKGLRKGSDGWLVARRLVQGTAHGRIFTNAGSKSTNQSASAVAFRRNLDSKHGKANRSIYKAFDVKGGENRVSREVIAVIRKWSDAFQRQLDSAGS